MIVISGALVLVALVLLIIGVVGPELSFVYASIAVSLVSLVFLVVGILQRRGETEPAAATAPTPTPAGAPADGVTAVVPSQEARASMRKVTQEAPVASSAEEELETGGTVLIVEGRPRYHVAGCRYLSGKSPEKIDVLDAREEGFSPCGVCKPDDALAEAGEQTATQELTAAQEPVVEEDVPGVEVPPARAARKAPTRTTAASKAAGRTTAPTTAPAKAPSKAATKAATKAVKAPAAKAPARVAVKAPVAAAPGRSSVKAPSKAAVAAAGPSLRAGQVVVIPDRGKYHRGECRFVRGVDGTEVLSKTAASRQGYAACGVCKP